VPIFTKSLNIAYISASLIPSRYANSVHVIKMSQAFVKKGHTVRLYVLEGDELGVNDDFEFYGVKKCFELIKLKHPSWIINKLKGLFFSYKVYKEIKKQYSIDILYSRHIYSLLWSSLLKLPMIYEVHTPPNNNFRKVAEKCILKKNNFLRLVVISDSLAKEYKKLYPWINEEKIRVVPDGADLLDFENDSSSTGDRRWPGRIKTIQIGYIGQLYKGKGIELICKVAPKLPEYDFHVIGGINEDIEKWKRNCDFDNIFFHGFVPHGKLQWYFNNIDIALAPYQSKVFAFGNAETSRWMSPLKIFEYMAAKKPIIASDIPVLREVLINNYNSLLVSSDNFEEWINAIKILANDYKLRDRIAKNAYKDLCENYTWEKRAEKVLRGL